MATRGADDTATAAGHDEEPVAVDGRHGLDQPPVPLGGGGTRRPAVVALAVTAILGLLVWQPWTPSSAAPKPSGSPGPAVANAEDVPSPSPVPSSTSVPTSAPGLGVRGVATYTVMTDNEWTVVALLAPFSPASTEEPAMQHAGATWSPSGPLLVLQQGLAPVLAPIALGGAAVGPCAANVRPRDRTAVSLPAGRVAYLGVTIPGSVPRPQITAARLGDVPGALPRAVAPAVRIAGLNGGGLSRIPSAGPGGAILFTAATPGPLPTGAYQIEVASPDAAGTRYLYACVAPVAP